VAIEAAEKYHRRQERNDGCGQLRMDAEKDVDSLGAAREYLRHRGWLAELPPHLREALLARSRLLPPFERGQAVFRIGDEPDGIYGTVSGTFAFQLAPNEQGPHTFHLYRPGAWFGELAHCVGKPRATTLIATRRSRCLRVPAQELEGLLNQEPELWRWLAVSLACNVKTAFCAVDDMTIRLPRRRIAAVLLRLAGSRGSGFPNVEPCREIDVTHNDIAFLANLSRSAVGENLRRLEEDGFLECSYGRIRLIDPAGLQSWVAATA
jgi:CRP-like cAMP-binding protein